MNFKNNNDDKCWDITNNIINNADCTHKMCEKTV